MSKTNIEWADYSWNPYTWDCTRVSPGCKNCYMMAMATKFNRPQVGRPQWRATAYRELKKIPAGSVVFVNSMSDTYHKTASMEMIHGCHNAALLYPELTFLILTKRAERALALSPQLAYPPNLWVGCSVENEDYLWRLAYLLMIPAAGHFVSAEPLLDQIPAIERYLAPGVNAVMNRHGTVDVYPAVRFPNYLRWVILGAESGANRRGFDKRWAGEIRDLCETHGVAFMFKQGSHLYPGRDRALDGQFWNQTPFIPLADGVVSAEDAPVVAPISGDVQMRLL
jgi:protein gp37